MNSKLEPRDADSYTIVFYEKDGTRSELDDDSIKQALLEQADRILQQNKPAQHADSGGPGTAIGQIVIEDDVVFTRNNQPVDTAAVAAAIAEALVEAIRQGLADEFAKAQAAVADTGTDSTATIAETIAVALIDAGYRGLADEFAKALADAEARATADTDNHGTGDAASDRQ